ncbi:MAG: hypothetical protein F6K56_20835 [Moorea sp. SIO3G5]|nr:hypothetical protein [Moorena sp. SIO3G5]
MLTNYVNKECLLLSIDLDPDPVMEWKTIKQEISRGQLRSLLAEAEAFRPRYANASSRSVAIWANRLWRGLRPIAQDVLPSSSAFNGAQTKIDQWHNEWVSFERKFDQIQLAYEPGRWVDVLNYAHLQQFATKRLLACLC